MNQPPAPIPGSPPSGWQAEPATGSAGWQPEPASGSGLEVVSALAVLALTPIGLLLLDQLADDSLRRMQFLDAFPPSTFGWTAAVVVVFSLIAALARQTWKGSLVAAILFGAIPTMAGLLKFQWVVDRIFDFRDLLPTDRFGFGLTTLWLIIFPLLTAMFTGLAFAGAVSSKN